MTVWPIKAARGGMAMSITRRDLLFASGMPLLTSPRPSRPGAAPPPQQPQTPTTPQARLLAALQGNRLPLTMTGGPAGPGWDWLVQQARDARFTLIGEEHGVAETAQLAGALFNTLRGSGYSRMAIELSPIIAQDIEAAGRRDGLQGILDFFAVPTTWRSEEHTSELQSPCNLVCRLLLEKKKKETSSRGHE